MLLGQREARPVAASAPAPATDFGWRSEAFCTKTPARECAQEGQADAKAQASETSFGRHTRAPSSRLLGQREGGPVAAQAQAPATDFGWRSGAYCT